MPDNEGFYRSVFTMNGSGRRSVTSSDATGHEFFHVFECAECERLKKELKELREQMEAKK